MHADHRAGDGANGGPDIPGRTRLWRDMKRASGLQTKIIKPRTIDLLACRGYVSRVIASAEFDIWFSVEARSCEV